MIVYLSSVDTGLLLTDLLITLIVKRTKKILGKIIKTKYFFYNFHIICSQITYYMCISQHFGGNFILYLVPPCHEQHNWHCKLCTHPGCFYLRAVSILVVTVLMAVIVCIWESVLTRTAVQCALWLQNCQ